MGSSSDSQKVTDFLVALRGNPFCVDDAVNLPFKIMAFRDSLAFGPSDLDQSQHDKKRNSFWQDIYLCSSGRSFSELTDPSWLTVDVPGSEEEMICFLCKHSDPSDWLQFFRICYLTQQTRPGSFISIHKYASGEALFLGDLTSHFRNAICLSPELINLYSLAWQLFCNGSLVDLLTLCQEVDLDCHRCLMSLCQCFFVRSGGKGQYLLSDIDRRILGSYTETEALNIRYTIAEISDEWHWISERLIAALHTKWLGIGAVTSDAGRWSNRNYTLTSRGSTLLEVGSNMLSDFPCFWVGEAKTYSQHPHNGLGEDSFLLLP